MGFVTRRVEATPKRDVPRIKRWIATYVSSAARDHRRQWQMRLRLIAKAREADSGQSVNTRGLSDEQFLTLLHR